MPEMSRRQVLGMIGGVAATPIIAGLASSTAQAAEDTLTLVSNHQPLSVIVISDSTDALTRKASETLATYVKKSTGATLPILTSTQLAQQEGTYQGWARINVGFVHPADESTVRPQLNGLDPDGYVITQNATGRMTMIGPSSFGTQYGVFEFLERFVGVSWLMPGENGEDVPLAATLTVGLTAIRDEPVMRNRVLSPVGGSANASTDPNVILRWGTFARMHQIVGTTQQNFLKIFPVATYGDPNKPATYHPEYYPIFNGVRYIPRSATDYFWQPSFQAPGVADVAANYIIAQFRANPSLRTFSLAVNDTHAFSDTDIDRSRINTFGHHDASAAYYSFVNAVAERVAVEFPTATLGALAYLNVGDPPPFSLHPMVIPFLTWDQGRWADTAGATSAQQLSQRWLAVANRFGWYDYLYGGIYVVPRMDMTARATAYRWAADAGIGDMYAELYPGWSEGAKPWVVSKLFWNPHADVDRLTADWCLRAAGSRGAPHLLAFHRLWESAWANVPTSTWFRATEQDPYLGFRFAGYLDSIPAETVREASTHLSRALEATQTPAQRARVQLMATAFSYNEASGLSYPRPATVPADQASAATMLGTATANLDDSIRYAAKRYELITQFASDPLLAIPFNPTGGGLNWSGWNMYVLWALAQYIRGKEPNGGTIRQQVQSLASSSSSANVRRFATMILAGADGNVVQRGANTSFESGTTAPWLIEYSSKPAVAAHLSTEVSIDGGTSLAVPLGFKSGGISQRFAVTPGFLRASFSYFTPAGGTPAKGAIISTWQCYNAAGTMVQLLRGSFRMLRDTTGQWSELVMAEMLRDDVVSVACYCSLWDTAASQTTLYLDKVSFTQIV